MHAECVGVVTNLFKSDRGRQYVTMTDQNTGGEFKFNLPGEIAGLREGQSIKLAGTFRGRRAKDGGLLLEYVDGTVKPVKISVEEG